MMIVWFELVFENSFMDFRRLVYGDWVWFILVDLRMKSGFSFKFVCLGRIWGWWYLSLWMSLKSMCVRYRFGWECLMDGELL